MKVMKLRRKLKLTKKMRNNYEFRILLKQNTTMMKSAIRIIILMVLASTVAFGQYEPKGKVSKAELALNANKLDEAKAEIDKAFEDNVKGKITTSSKNWYTRGKIYSAIFKDEGDFKDLDEDALAKAVESFNKVIELEGKENGTYTFLSSQEIQSLYNSTIDSGATAYNSGDLETALESFKTALIVKPEDSLALLYGGSVAQELDNYDEAAELYDKLIRSGNAGESVYSSIIYIYKAQKEDMDKAMEYTDMAIKQFPENKSYMQEKIYYLITSGKSKEAEQQIMSQIEAHPDDALLRFELGYLYDEKGEEDKALDAYGMAIELDPNYYDAIFNYAVIHYNKGADIIKEFNDMPLGSNYNPQAYAKKEKEYIDKAKPHFETALPYFEKAYSIKSDDVKLIEILGGVYKQLGMMEKYNEMNEKLSTLEGDEDME